MAFLARCPVRHLVGGSESCLSGSALLLSLSVSAFLSARRLWWVSCVSTHVGPRVLVYTAANFAALSSGPAWRHRCCSSMSSSDLASAHASIASLHFALLCARSDASSMLVPVSSEVSAWYLVSLLARSICVTKSSHCLRQVRWGASFCRTSWFLLWCASKFLELRVVYIAQCGVVLELCVA